jgi:hypothetical protein
VNPQPRNEHSANAHWANNTGQRLRYPALKHCAAYFGGVEVELGSLLFEESGGVCESELELVLSGGQP